MNQQAFDSGKEAYRAGNLGEAYSLLSQAKQPGEVSGATDHLIGNCLMRMGRYAEAAQAYGDALRDQAYGHAGALACNRGRALLAAGRPQDAVASLVQATKDASYATTYKAYVAMGQAYEAMGSARDAAVAYRNAALDERNPDPSSALRSLGDCFMKMGRAVDAVESYRTALDYTPLANQSATYGDLGLAYVAANRMSEAVDAFGQATADGSYQLSPEAQAAYDAAKRAVDAIGSNQPSETDALLSGAGFGVSSYDPLDPTGASGELMPSPEDTGFFSVTEADLMKQDEQARRDRKSKKKGKRKHPFLHALLVILIILIILGAAGGFAYYKGYGWPTQEATVEDLFNAGASSGDVSSYLADSVSEEERTKIEAILPTSTTSVHVDGKDCSMTNSSVVATATLGAGGTQTYQVELVRDRLGWKVTSVSTVYGSEVSTDGSGSATTGTISTSN